ncbi:MAG: hypothetical protein J7551_10180 [Chloroflexi bacterium]|nr:hypothetical protein [Chloroflexota bacterium]
MPSRHLLTPLCHFPAIFPNGDGVLQSLGNRAELDAPRVASPLDWRRDSYEP